MGKKEEWNFLYWDEPMVENKTYVKVCKSCGDKIPSGLSMDSICVDCLTKPK